MLGLSVLALTAASLFVPVDQAAQLVASGAVVLDARESGYLLGHLPGAVRADWKDYRDSWGRTGRLDADPSKLARLRHRLGDLGIGAGRTVLVYGDAAAGFGEEGRIAWMLAYLGHSEVHILDGGIAAWRAAGRRLERGLQSRRERGSPPAALAVQPQWRADKAAVLAAVQDPARGTVVLDVRERAEWHGATPYFEARGGHIPTARHLAWRELLDGSGRLRSPAQVRALLHRAGILPDAGNSAAAPPIIVYCTGGVRSALVWAALRSSGLEKVRNYDGSFWEWAADRALPVTVEPALR